MNWLEMLAVAAFGALCWGHGYSRARMRDASMHDALSKAYQRGRRDERADAGKDSLL